jgi:hypothetical protein
MPEGRDTPSSSTFNLTNADYFTKIYAFQYKRTRPSDSPKVDANGMITINLPLPVQFPADHYSAATSPIELGIAGNSYETLTNLGYSDYRDKIVTGVLAGGAAMTAALSALAGLSKKSGASDKLLKAGAAGITALNEASPYIAAYSGTVKNPKTALLFNGMNLRQITYHFRLTPRNEGESRDIQSMLVSTRNLMHPTYSEIFNSFALDYPRLFTVSYDDKTNKVMGYPKMGPSFLIDMQINNASAGNAFFKNGLPAIVDLSLTFAEIDMKTRESFTGAYNKDTRSVGDFLSDKADQAWDWIKAQ